ncbi:MAG: FtsH protease activity modulator HflK [Bdellovibrionota bacterium]|nr:FtsH protease activity modulator HflK [Bdellovibrionota bacterium]
MNSYNNQPNFEADLAKFFNEFKNNFKFIGTGLIILFLLVLGSTSFYTVEPEEEAVIIRLGKYEGTYPPGLHFKIPLGVDRVIKVKTKKIHQISFGFVPQTSGRRLRFRSDAFDDESLMLTGDLNVADVEWVVQFQISDPFKFLFQTASPEKNIKDVSESIMRRVIGDRLVTEVLTTGRVEIAAEVQELMQSLLNKYDMGVQIFTVQLQNVNPPEIVKASFNEVNEAKQEQEKVINQAEEAYNKVIPEARGKAEKQISEAEGFAEATVNRAKGDAKKFTSVLLEYKRAPAVTRKRMYLETMEEVLSKLDDLTIIDSKVKGVLPIFQKTNESIILNKDKS